MTPLLLHKHEVTGELLRIDIRLVDETNFIQPWRAVKDGNGEAVDVYVYGPRGGRTVFGVVAKASEKHPGTFYGVIWRQLPDQENGRREQSFDRLDSIDAVKREVQRYFQTFPAHPQFASHHVEQPINPVEAALPANINEVVQANVEQATVAVQPAAVIEVDAAVEPQVRPGQWYASVVCSHQGPEQLVSVGAQTGYDSIQSLKRALYTSATKNRYNWAGCTCGFLGTVAASKGNNKPHARVAAALVSSCSRELAGKILTCVATGQGSLRELIFAAPGVDQIAIALEVGCLRIKKAAQPIAATVDALSV